MTQQQAARNAAAERNLADKFIGWGLSEPEARAQRVVAELLEDGLAPIPKAERDRQLARRPGPGSTAAERAKHKAEIDRQLEEARRRRKRTEPPQLAHDWQLRQLGELLALDGMHDRGERLQWASAMVDRELGSATELTAEEARNLINGLLGAAGGDGEPADAQEPAQLPAAELPAPPEGEETGDPVDEPQRAAEPVGSEPPY